MYLNNIYFVNFEKQHYLEMPFYMFENKINNTETLKLCNKEMQTKCNHLIEKNNIFLFKFK